MGRWIRAKLVCHGLPHFGRAGCHHQLRENTEIRYVDAAVAVLIEDGRPLTSAEITERAITRGLLNPGGRTPEASMSAALYLEALRPGGRLIKIAIPGRIRAVRGSVRWTVRAGHAQAES